MRTHRPEIDAETMDRLVAAAAAEEALDEPERVARQRPTQELITAVIDARDEWRAAANRWAAAYERVQPPDNE